MSTVAAGAASLPVVIFYGLASWEYQSVEASRRSALSGLRGLLYAGLADAHDIEIRAARWVLLFARAERASQEKRAGEGSPAAPKACRSGVR